MQKNKILVSIAITSDDSNIVSVSGNDIAVFSPQGNEIARGKKHTRPTFTVCISPDDQFIYAGAYDNDVTKWDVTSSFL